MSVQRARQLRKVMSAPEAKLWNALRALRSQGFHFRRQVPLGPYYADFVCHRSCLVIEVDGETHAGAAALAHDGWRDAFLKQEGYRVLRVSNSDVMANTAGVITVVLGLLEEPPPSIPPNKGEGSLAGGGGGVAG